MRKRITLFNMSAGRRRTGLGDDDDTLKFETSDEVYVIPTFDAMGLREELLRGIYAYGESDRKSGLSRGDKVVTWLQ